MFRRSLFFLLTSLSFCGSTQLLSAEAVQYTSPQGARFEIKDRIGIPTYAWPTTLLNYTVDFQGLASAEKLRLLDGVTGKSIPIQLSEITERQGRLERATVSFLSDLPSGATRAFRLVEADVPAPFFAGALAVSDERDGMVEVTTPLVGVRIPLSREGMPQGEIPGPILGLKRGTKWIGGSRLEAGTRRLKAIETKQLNRGPLFAEYSVSYIFEAGGVYTARIKLDACSEHIEFHETIAGIGLEDGLRVEMTWSGFQPQYRFGGEWSTRPVKGQRWMGIDKPITSGVLREDPRWANGWQEDPAKEMAIRLSPYSGNGVREAVPHASFWEDQPGGAELGVFVLGAERWQDYRYEVWQHSTLLQVRFKHGVPAGAAPGSPAVLQWIWPLATGSRSTGIVLHDAGVGEAKVDKVQQVYNALGKEVKFDRLRFSASDLEIRYVQLLRTWNSFLSLDRVKDWTLAYPERGRPAPSIFTQGPTTGPADYEAQLRGSQFVFYPLGLNTWPGVNSINHRFVYEWVVDGYIRFQKAFDPAQRERIQALLLLSGYITTSEDMHPIRNVVAGAPNMAADGWSVPIQMAMLFPDHPMAGEWRDYFELTMRLSSHFFTRPDVSATESKGGRWTESLGTYNWAHLRPTSLGLLAGLVSDGKNRWANPSNVIRGRWMVDMLSAPIFNPDPYWRQNWKRKTPPPALAATWKPGDALSPELGFQRQYPPQGAHSSGTGMEAPPSARAMGFALLRYSPLIGENLIWATHKKGAKPGVQAADFEDGHKGGANWMSVQKKLFDPDNNGTPPDLMSEKYTGHGIVLRAGVNTPEELSLHLNQIDHGPNYRWGNAGEGASGSLYFFAQGKIFTAHERESAGDRTLNDTDGVTTFGVMKNGSYRSIGMNLLEEPLYDLGVAQFAELRSRQDSAPYSWPEYMSRNALLVGTDYFILSDEVGTGSATPTRFAWFTAKDQSFPKFIFLHPAAIRDDHWTELRTGLSKGFHRDLQGSHQVLVTPNESVSVVGLEPVALPFLEEKSLKEYRRKREASGPTGVTVVDTPSSRDVVFRPLKEIEYTSKGESFSGSVGVVRRRKNGNLELAIMRGRSIAADGIVVTVGNPQMGLSVVRSTQPELTGRFYSREGGEVALAYDGANRPGVTFYVDGARLAHRVKNGMIEVTLPAGAGAWQLTADRPTPARSAIVGTVNRTGGARVFWRESAGADAYRLEVSSDGANSWKALATVASAQASRGYELAGLAADSKVHLRVIALNGNRETTPSPAYPLYVSDQKPLPPDGLTLGLGLERVSAEWGEVLGVQSYRLYRRATGKKDWELVYEGKDTQFVDAKAVGVSPPAKHPGSEGAVSVRPGPYEYAVTAVNTLGEGPKCTPVATTPTSWLNWVPEAADLRFRRRTAYWQPPYVSEEEVPPLYYPEK